MSSNIIIPWAVISDPTRRILLDYLFKNKMKSVQSISDDTKIPLANVSQHLTKLTTSKVVEFRKNGAQHCYRMTKFGRKVMEYVYEAEIDLKEQFKTLG